MSPVPVAVDPGSRARILDAALTLMSERGVAGTSMRQLAGASRLNVATLYHYFPSKADVVRAVIAERAYVHRLQVEHPPPEVRLPDTPAGRLRALAVWLWEACSAEEEVWRLLVGESMRGEGTVQAEAAAIVEAVGDAMVAWCRDAVPELGDRARPVASTLRSLLFSSVLEHLVVGRDDDRARDRIEAFVAAVLPE